MLKDLNERLVKMESSTVARSDSQDDAVSAPAKKDVFAGVFSGNKQ